MNSWLQGKAIFLSLFFLSCLWTGARASAAQELAESPPPVGLQDGVIILSNVYPAVNQSASSDNHSSSNESTLFRGAENDTIRQTSHASPVTAYESLASAITSARSSRRRAALRMVEEARQLLEAGQYEKALRRLETSLGLDANPYNYFYLALTHHRLSQHAEAIAFLNVAESSFNGQPNWKAELLAWKEINQGALQAVPTAATTLGRHRLLATKQGAQAESAVVDRRTDELLRKKQHQSGVVDLLVMGSSLSFFWLLIWLASSARLLRHEEK